LATVLPLEKRNRQREGVAVYSKQEERDKERDFEELPQPTNEAKCCERRQVVVRRQDETDKDKDKDETEQSQKWGKRGGRTVVTNRLPGCRRCHLQGAHERRK
jgi:hypothetical protein